MNANDIVNELVSRGATIRLAPGDGPGPTVLVDSPAGALDGQISDAIRANRTMIINVLLGQYTGHVLAPCTKCGQETMVHVGRAVRGCRMTSGCDGRHEIPPGHLTATALAANTKPPTEAPLAKRPAKARLLGERATWDPS